MKVSFPELTMNPYMLNDLFCNEIKIYRFEDVLFQDFICLNTFIKCCIIACSLRTKQSLKDKIKNNWNFCTKNGTFEFVKRMYVTDGTGNNSVSILSYLSNIVVSSDVYNTFRLRYFPTL